MWPSGDGTRNLKAPWLLSQPGHRQRMENTACIPNRRLPSCRPQQQEASPTRASELHLLLLPDSALSSAPVCVPGEGQLATSPLQVPSPALASLASEWRHCTQLCAGSAPLSHDQRSPTSSPPASLPGPAQAPSPTDALSPLARPTSSRSSRRSAEASPHDGSLNSDSLLPSSPPARNPQHQVQTLSHSFLSTFLPLDTEFLEGGIYSWNTLDTRWVLLESTVSEYTVKSWERLLINVWNHTSITQRVVVSKQGSKRGMNTSPTHVYPVLITWQQHSFKDMVANAFRLIHGAGSTSFLQHLDHALLCLLEALCACAPPLQDAHCSTKTPVGSFTPCRSPSRTSSLTTAAKAAFFAFFWHPAKVLCNCSLCHYPRIFLVTLTTMWNHIVTCLLDAGLLHPVYHFTLCTQTVCGLCR